MPGKSKLDRGWSRREFLEAGVGGFAALYLANTLGCTGERGVPRASSQTAKKGFVRPMPSPWFIKLGNGRVRCQLCPRRCELAAGERAICRVRENRGGVGYTLAYGNPAIVQEDPIERKPFFHVLPGSRSLSVATAGCNLACKFCEAWDMTQASPEDVHAYDMLPERLVAHARAV
ncbi:MAG: radical SAM protein, partial [Dehalococcoidia bacterium]|nr:radical SAM protein [Dehalococcoidia bacterium]